jgi:competence protein ComEA
VTRRLFCFVLLAFLALAACSGPAAEITITTRTPSYEGLIYVGGVNNPGLYPFSNEDTLAGLIGAAGGLKDVAGVQAELSFGAPDASQRIDVNRAESWLLEALPGVGAATAANICAYRQATGSFRSLEDLLKVPGVGPALLARITPYVTVGGE